MIRIPSEAGGLLAPHRTEATAVSEATGFPEAGHVRSGNSSRGERLLPEIPRGAAAAAAESRLLADHFRLAAGGGPGLLDAGDLLLMGGGRKGLQIREAAVGFFKSGRSQGPKKYLMGLKNVKKIIKAGVYIRVGLTRSFGSFINYFINLFYEIRLQKFQNLPKSENKYFHVQ